MIAGASGFFVGPARTVGMGNFADRLHPRSRDGRFSQKRHDEADSQLQAPDNGDVGGRAGAVRTICSGVVDRIAGAEVEEQQAADEALAALRRSLDGDIESYERLSAMHEFTGWMLNSEEGHARSMSDTVTGLLSASLRADHGGGTEAAERRQELMARTVELAREADMHARSVITMASTAMSTAYVSGADNLDVADVAEFHEHRLRTVHRQHARQVTDAVEEFADDRERELSR